MSDVEIRDGGIRFPAWAVGAVFAIIMGWMGWMSITLISTKEELVELRSQVRSNAVPEGTEKALSEIRLRMNAELAGKEAMAKLATENAKDITYLMKEIDRLKAARQP